MTTDPLVMMLVGGVCAAVPALFLALMKAHASALADLTDQRNTYKAIADRAVARLEEEATERHRREGAVPSLVIAPVLPEHASPVTPRQQETADIATLRARLVAAELGRPPLSEEAP